MSHPNPSHDRENEHKEDHYKPVAKSKALKKKLTHSMKKGRSVIKEGGREVASMHFK